MTRSFDRVVIECGFAKRLAAFWAAAIGYQPSTVTESGIAALEHPDGCGPRLWFVTVPDPKPSGRVLRLNTDELDQDVEILQGLGASIVRESDEWGHRVVLLRDPEGNEFDVVGPATADADR